VYGMTKYNSNLSDTQFQLIVKHIPVVKTTRPRKYTIHELINAIMYILLTGCRWRDLPTDMPPWRSVYHYFYKLKVNKYLDKILYGLNYKYLRHKNRRYEYILITDSQSVRSSNVCLRAHKGYDGNKKVSGHKRFVLVDTLSCVWSVFTVKANESEKTALEEGVYNQYSNTKAKPKQFTVLLADKGFESQKLTIALKQKSDITLYAMKSTHRRKDTSNLQFSRYNQDYNKQIRNYNKSISQLRWRVEQIFAHLDSCRRLIINYERKMNTHTAFVKLALIRLQLRRLG
jgi:transposase